MTYIHLHENKGLMIAIISHLGMYRY